MRPLVQLRQDFEVSRTLGDIIDVLKTAATIQFRTLQQKEKFNETFSKEINLCIKILLEKKVKHPYLLERKELKSTIVVVTSDEGFLGGLNTLLINKTMDQKHSPNDEIVVLGERGARYLEDLNQKFIFFPGVTDQVRYEEVTKVRDYLLNGYRKNIGRIIIVYPEFVSLTLQRVTAMKFLPWTPEVHLNNDDVALKAQFSKIFLDEVLIEPDNRWVLEAVIDLWSGYKLQDIFWSAKQSEFAARIMHLEGSTQELNFLTHKLSLEYFRQIHALKDKIIREISASKILLGRQKAK